MKLTIIYTIGSTDDIKKETNVISKNNKFLPVIIGCLDKLKEQPDHAGISLGVDDLFWNHENKIINDTEYYIFLACLYSARDYERSDGYIMKASYEITEENQKYIQEFEGLLTDETEYSYLVYKSYKILGVNK